MVTRPRRAVPCRLASAARWVRRRNRELFPLNAGQLGSGEIMFHRLDQQDRYPFPEMAKPKGAINISSLNVSEWVSVNPLDRLRVGREDLECCMATVSRIWRTLDSRHPIPSTVKRCGTVRNRVVGARLNDLCDIAQKQTRPDSIHVTVEPCGP